MADASRSRRLARSSLIVLALVWTGVLVGAAFLAAPAPFMAESLDRAAALDVNRHLFRALSRSETVLLTLTLLAGFMMGPGRLVQLGLALLATAVLAESLWLLPALEARAAMILAGQEPPPATYHALYISLEAAKLVLLPALAWAAVRTSGSSATRAGQKNEGRGNRIAVPPLARPSD